MPRDAVLRDWFEDIDKQEHAARLGMWLFLASEALLFAGLFGLYASYRVQHGAAFLAASHHNSVAIGTTNTFVLITSSFTVAWAIHCVREAEPERAVRALAATLILAGLFLVFKGVEYGQHFQHGIFPSGYYRFSDLPQHGARLFFTLYFFMTGLHALHVVGGMAALAVVLWRTHRGRMTAERHIALELTGLYWHLVDAVWIFLWPLLYLAG